MHTTNTSLPVFPASIGGATLSHYASVTEDGTLCFVSDRVYRACPDCGTVFAGSAYRTAFDGPPACPYCGEPQSRPLPPRRLS
ncbi:MAG: hypothetical protein AB7D37_18540 [Desulfovibrio sp.]